MACASEARSGSRDEDQPFGVEPVPTPAGGRLDGDRLEHRLDQEALELNSLRAPQGFKALVGRRDADKRLLAEAVGEGELSGMELCVELLAPTAIAGRAPVPARVAAMTGAYEVFILGLRPGDESAPEPAGRASWLRDRERGLEHPRAARHRWRDKSAQRSTLRRYRRRRATASGVRNDAAPTGAGFARTAVASDPSWRVPRVGVELRRNPLGSPPGMGPGPYDAGEGWG
jgi:hypothetical protein